MRRSSAAPAILILAALACARSSAPPPPPAPVSVEPASVYAGRQTALLVRGDSFEPRVLQQLGGGTHLGVDDGFRAFVGDVELEATRFVDVHTLAATAPATLAPGDYPLTVEGPYGRGSVTGAFHVVQGIPPLLTAVATAPARALTGEDILVSVSVSNGGQMSALGVAAGTATASGPTATLQAPSESADIAGGSAHAFLWHAQAAAPGLLSLTLPVAGKDAVDGSPVGATATASVLIVTPAHLVAAPRPPPPSQPAGPTFELFLDVTNDGGSDALGVQFDALAGASGLVDIVSAPGPQDIPAGETRTFVWTIRGTAEGTAQLACSGSGVDATDGSTVAAGQAQWTVIIFNAVALLFPTFTVPPGALPNETFSVSLTLSNPGIVDALGVQLSIAVSGSGTVALQSAPAGSDVRAGTSATFVWTYTATGLGPVRFDVQATGTDARSTNPVTASASGATVIAAAAPVASDPFGDGTSFAYVFAYANRVYLGPSADGARAVRMRYDGTAREMVDPSYLTDPNGVKNSVSPTPPAFPSLGYAGCTPDTLQCGPDDEDGRGLFTSVVIGGTEWMFAAGSRQTSILKHVYLSTDVTADPAFQYVPVNPLGGSRGTTAAATLGTALYVGFADAAGSGNPVLLKMTGFPADSTQPLNLTIADAQVPSTLHSPRGTGLIDAMIGFSGSLYAANDGGCSRYGGTAWTACTPGGTTWSAKTSISTTKSSDFVPADKAVPQMAAFNGRLYLARNTTAGPQLWACAPAGGICSSGNWSIVPNGSLDPTLSQMDDPALGTISLLVATSQHLYVGYDSAAGARLFRSTSGSPSNANDFSGVAGTGLGSGVTQILDGEALTASTGEFLYVVARNGTGPASVYRLAP